MAITGLHPIIYVNDQYAERAFYLLADRIAKDKPSDRLGPGAPADGLFGDYNRRLF